MTFLVLRSFQDKAPALPPTGCSYVVIIGLQLTLSWATEQYRATGAILKPLCLYKQLTLCSQQHIDELFPSASCLLTMFSCNTLHFNFAQHVYRNNWLCPLKSSLFRILKQHRRGRGRNSNRMMNVYPIEVFIGWGSCLLHGCSILSVQQARSWYYVGNLDHVALT